MIFKCLTFLKDTRILIHELKYLVISAICQGGWKTKALTTKRCSQEYHRYTASFHTFILSFLVLAFMSGKLLNGSNSETASRTCIHFARAVEVASNIQKNFGMGRLCSDSTERCGAELEWLPHEGWVPAGSWTHHLPTPVQISESESTLNYQLQQELPNLLTAPISSGGMFQYCSWHCFPITVRVTKMKDEVYNFRWERQFNPHLKKELQKLLGFLHLVFKNQTLEVEFTNLS